MLKKSLPLILAFVLGLAIAAAAFWFFCGASAEGNDAAWEYALEDIICIGDSLTEGAYIKDGEAGIIEQSYPLYLERMLSTRVCNAGASGFSASDWYTQKADEYNYAEYSTAIIWLGTNNGYTDTLAEDVEPFDDYNDFAETETGYYCRIIERIREENPQCLILLMNIYASKDDVELSNTVIDKIAQRYDLHVIDTGSLNMEQTQLHAGITNPHLGKAGNIAAARLIINDVRDWISAAPIRCDFALKYK